MNRKRILFIRNTASPQNTLLLGLLLLILSFFIMPEAIKQIQQYPQDANLIDLQLWYSPTQVTQMLQGLGENGRKLYLAVELTADLFFWLVAGGFLCSFLLTTARRLNPQPIKTTYLLALPALVIVFNLLENSGIAWMVVQYPAKFHFLALASAFSTFSRWLCLAICLGFSGYFSFLLLQHKIIKLLPQIKNFLSNWISF